MSNQPKRFREYGLTPGLLSAGPKNLISDVAGVTVGHYTKRQAPDINTGITIIDPGVANLFRSKLPAAIAVGNGYGKLAGLSQVNELGVIEAPIALTNTLAVGPVLRGMVDVVIQNTPDLGPLDSINVVVGEVNDGRVNNIHKNSLGTAEVQAAYQDRRADFALGSVGAGTGSRAFAWKGGIGSASRIVRTAGSTYTVGALVQTNFGGALTILGVPVGQLLGSTDFDNLVPGPDGSCMIVLATDAPLGSLQLGRLAKRGLLGMVRTGSIMADGSGDYAI
ncbi:MAG TPA: P1 family peptidase, partial [Candidatus Acidoferrum sp.]|nr:P1 family peptidase [Candidatus Acidoferrum sp.]